MASLKDLIATGIPGGVPEETDLPTVEDNRMPKIAVDPFGLLYKPDPTVEFQYGVPESNFDGETLKDDRYLGPLKDKVLAKVEEPEEPPVEPEEPPVADEEVPPADEDPLA